MRVYSFCSSFNKRPGGDVYNKWWLITLVGIFLVKFLKCLFENVLSTISGFNVIIALNSPHLSD